MVDLKDEDGRRYGDWQKKDLRQNSNEILKDPTTKAWYYQTFWIIIFLLVFWPVGIVLCWRSDWPMVAKIGASAFVAFCVIGMLYIYSGTNLVAS